MNQKELGIAKKLTIQIRNEFVCPHCENKLEASTMVPIQAKCPHCLLKITLYIDEGASRIFDKQRQVEKPVAVTKAAPANEAKKWRDKAVKNAGKKQKSKRVEKRVEEQKVARKLGIRSVEERRQSRSVRPNRHRT